MDTLFLAKQVPLLLKQKNARILALKVCVVFLSLFPIHCTNKYAKVLKQGGNAVDAAIASGLCIGVIDSFATGKFFLMAYTLFLIVNHLVKALVGKSIIQRFDWSSVKTKPLCHGIVVVDLC